MSLQRAVAFVLAQETGAIVHAQDGVSCWGISQANHPELTVDQIIAMAEHPEQAAAIIGGPQYWGACHANDVPDWLQTPLLDACVNQGAHAAMVCLQQALRVSADGKYGPATHAAVFASKPNDLLPRFAAYRVMSYSRDSTWATDGLGWTTRAVLAAIEAQ